MAKKVSSFNLILSLFILLAALTFIGTTAFMVLRLKGTQSEARGKPVRQAGTLTISPNPVPAHTQPTVIGNGFQTGEELLVGIPGDLRFTPVTADSGGGFSFVYTNRDLTSGYTYTMEAWGQQGNKRVLKSSTTFFVQ